MKNKLNIAVIGGGTGTVTVLRGLKKYKNLSLNAIVTMTDSGGSTGRLRDEFGILPVGDVRQCLVALAKEEKTSQLLRDLFLYRFPDNSSTFSGHNFGNIFLTALSQILGNEEQAIEATAKIFNVKGNIIPITTDNVNLVAQYKNGDVLYGEGNIDSPPITHDSSQKLTKLWTQPRSIINPKAKETIENADFIIMGPGDLYSSLLSNLVVTGAKEAFINSKAKVIYISNLMSVYGQTHNMKQSDYIKELKKYAGRKPDYVIVNNTKLPNEGLNLYEQENSLPIKDDLPKKDWVIRSDILNKEIIKRSTNDKVKRSLIRHDSDKLAKLLIDILNK